MIDFGGDPLGGEIFFGVERRATDSAMAGGSAYRLVSPGVRRRSTPSSITCSAKEIRWRWFSGVPVSFDAEDRGFADGSVESGDAGGATARSAATGFPTALMARRGCDFWLGRNSGGGLMVLFGRRGTLGMGGRFKVRETVVDGLNNNTNQSINQSITRKLPQITQSTKQEQIK